MIIVSTRPFLWKPEYSYVREKSKNLQAGSFCWLWFELEIYGGFVEEKMKTAVILQLLDIKKKLQEGESLKEVREIQTAERNPDGSRKDPGR